MPKVIEAVKCEQCSKLVDAKSYYITIENISIKDKGRSNFHGPHYDRVILHETEETTFCSQDCVIQYINAKFEDKIR
jgi:hypothetical protein